MSNTKEHARLDVLFQTLILENVSFWFRVDKTFEHSPTKSSNLTDMKWYLFSTSKGFFKTFINSCSQFLYAVRWSSLSPNLLVCQEWWYKLAQITGSSPLMQWCWQLVRRWPSWKCLHGHSSLPSFDLIIEIITILTCVTQERMFFSD